MHPNTRHGLHQGHVIRLFGKHCGVRDPQGQEHSCVVRGRLRIHKSFHATNPVAVGDHVLFAPPQGDAPGVITEVLPRHNYLLRRAIAHGDMAHVLCANIDQAALLYTLIHPRTSPGFADRFLTAAAAYHIPVIILVNKRDLYQTPELQEDLHAFTHIYTRMGHQVHHISAHNPQDVQSLQQALAHKITFVSGHSGAGKSTLLNALLPNLHLPTTHISHHTGKGQHTTTHSEAFDLPFGGMLIDSPGIKELGMAHFTAPELAGYLPDFRPFAPQCRFADCYHDQEPGCAVKQALEQGHIAPSRYQSYLSMLQELRPA